MTQRKPRAVGYARVSTADQVNGLGLDVQEAAIQTLCKAQGFRLVGIERDEGISGDNGVDARRGLYDALDAIDAGRAEVLVVYSLDRLARKVSIQEPILEQVWARGASVFSTLEGGEVPKDDPDDPFRTAMREQRGVWARLERGLIAKRMRDGRAQKARKGGYVGGKPRYGMRAEGKALVVDEGEQELVARVLALRAQGASYREVCAVLEVEGYKPRRAAHWSPATVRNIEKRST
jgi:DNA invertase Pin-like site-specific DNA recombinase